MATSVSCAGWSTKDLEEARDRLEEDYGARLRIDEAAITNRTLSVDRRSAANFSIDTVLLPAQLTFDCADTDVVIVNTMHAGTLTSVGGGMDVAYRRGDVFLAAFPGADYRCHTDHTTVRSVAMPTRYLTEAAGTAPTLRFLSVNPMTSAAAATWTTILRGVERIMDHPELHEPLVLCESARMLAECIVATFPVTTTPGTAALGRLMPVDLRRVIAYMEQHAADDISVWDIARAADLTPAGVAYLFRRHLDKTPMAHLRRIRLDRAHHELLAAEPCGATVSGIAARWGFWDVGRFAAFYRSCYAQSPYVTLRE